MYTVFMLVLLLVLLWQRKKIHWPGLLIGAVLTVLLMGTPLGAPLTDAAHALANGFGQIWNGLLAMVKGAK
jgi:H+/gluconate symporter-like permease